MSKIKDQIIELNQNYNDLGEDLLLLEAVVLTVQGENDFPQEYVTSSINRMMGCIAQHTEDIRFLSGLLHKEASLRRENSKRYGRVRRQHRRLDASPHTRGRFASDRTDYRTSAKQNKT